MRRKHSFIKAFFALALLLALCLAPQRAEAWAEITTSSPVSLTLELKDDGTAVSGAKFSLYRVADVSADAVYTPTGSFSKTQVSLDTADATSADWADRALALQGEVAAGGITTNLTGETDENGRLYFNSGQVKTGMYLLLGETVSANGATYTPKPMLVSLPYLSGNAWDYNPVLSLKYEKTDNGGTDNPVNPSNPSATSSPAVSAEDISVVVVWDDNDDEAGLRPEQVTVVLMRGTESSAAAQAASVWARAVTNAEAGVAASPSVSLLTTWSEYDRVSLGEQQNWRHTWENVPSASDWSVSEEQLPVEYHWTVRREGNTFIITNTLDSDEPSPEPSDTSEPSDPVSPTPTVNDVKDARLPQTGQLWWPVLVLAACGLLLVLGGIWLRRKSRGK